MGKGFHPNRITELETRFAAQYGATGERRTAQQWQKRLWGFVVSAGPRDNIQVGPKPKEVGVERMPCPADLRMTDRQRAHIMEQLGYSFDRLVHLEGVYRVRYGLSSAEELSLEEWRRRLAGFVIKAGRSDRVMTPSGPAPGKPAVFQVKEPRPVLADRGPKPQPVTDEQRQAMLDYWKQPFVPVKAPSPAPEARLAPEDIERLRRTQEEARRRFAQLPPLPAKPVKAG